LCNWQGVANYAADFSVKLQLEVKFVADSIVTGKGAVNYEAVLV